MRHLLIKKRAISCLVMAWFMLPSMASAETTISFDRALRMASANAPELRATQSNIAVAKAQVDASDDWRSNPTLSLASGPRFGDTTSIDVMVGLEMPIVFGATLDGQTAVASAAQWVVKAESEHQKQVVLVATAQAFANTLYWQYRVELATANLGLVTEIEAVAAARKAAGDSGALESSIALLARHRAQAEIAQLQASRMDALGHLRWLVGLDANVELAVEGDLKILANSENFDAGRTPADQNTDVAVARAKIGEAKASQELAANAKVPELSLGAEGGIEENSPLLRATLAMTLPIFWRGASDIQVGVAREQAQTEEAQVVETRVKHQTQVAAQKARLLDSTLQAFANEGIPEARKAAEIANATYKAGAMPLPDLLVVRRELSAAEEQFAELMLLAALARIDVLASTGAINNIIQNDN
jgi:outer membrane protein TolC